jgi:hypothetical protein
MCFPFVGVVYDVNSIHAVTSFQVFVSFVEPHLPKHSHKTGYVWNNIYMYT